MPKPETRPTVDRPPPSAISRNRLLAALPGDAYTRLAPTLDIVPLTLKAVLTPQASRFDTSIPRS
jgi:hypothetical protein